MKKLSLFKEKCTKMQMKLKSLKKSVVCINIFLSKIVLKCFSYDQYDSRLQSESVRLETLRLNDKAETEDF